MPKYLTDRTWWFSTGITLLALDAALFLWALKDSAVASNGGEVAWAWIKFVALAFTAHMIDRTARSNEQTKAIKRRTAEMEKQNAERTEALRRRLFGEGKPLP